MNKLLLAFKDGEIGAEQQAKIRQLAPNLDLVQTADETKTAAMWLTKAKDTKQDAN